MKNETRSYGTMLLYNPSESLHCKNRSMCAHTNSVHNTLQFLQCMCLLIENHFSCWMEKYSWSASCAKKALISLKSAFEEAR